jgi:hypothetical protein
VKRGGGEEREEMAKRVSGGWNLSFGRNVSKNRTGCLTGEGGRVCFSPAT